MPRTRASIPGSRSRYRPIVLVRVSSLATTTNDADCAGEDGRRWPSALSQVVREWPGQKSTLPPKATGAIRMATDRMMIAAATTATS